MYGPTRLDDPEATWKIVWTGEEDVREHMPFARLSYTKGLGWWDGGLKRLISERGREMLIGPMPPALPILEHAGLGVRSVDNRRGDGGNLWLADGVLGAILRSTLDGFARDMAKIIGM